MTAKSAEAIALFRYRVIASAISRRLSPADRGQLVRVLARQLNEHPDGSQRQYSRGTLDRWIRAYREQGLDGLKPDPRADLGAVRRHPELFDEACALRVELPTRSAAQIGGSKRAYLFVLVDDYSRLLVHGRWVPDQNTRAGQDVLRAAIQRRGLPERLYVDYADLRIMPTWTGDGDQAGLRLSA